MASVCLAHFARSFFDPMLGRHVFARLARGAPAAAAAAAAATTLSSGARTLRRFAVTTSLTTDKVGRRAMSTDASPANPPIAKPAKKHEFQAATQKLLQIVANSLYSEKEVFLRELVSNASDALEKVRYAQVTGTLGEAPLDIKLTTNELDRTLTLTDSGIGMTEDELVQYLGTIAHSGSKEYLQNLQGSGPKDNIIGQFGVGFYSAFMVADKITVKTRSALGNTPGYLWVSDGAGSYEISELGNDVPLGTSIELKLKDDCKDFSKKATIETIIKKYSNFVGFPILVNGDRVNTLQPLWTMNKDKVTTEQHTDFYRYISHSSDSPLYTLHYSTDAPINLRAVLYVPERNPEHPSINRTDFGINLYARKVLIQSKVQELLPEWLRFLKGVADSEDIPLNLSREMLQDSALIRRIKTVITNRVIRWLDEEAKRDEVKYQKFLVEFGQFIREGLWLDKDQRDRIVKLLRFPTSAPLFHKDEDEEDEDEKESGQDKKDKKDDDSEDDDSEDDEPVKTQINTSLAGYVQRMKPEQKAIYYLVASSRATGLASPYYEAFKNKGYEVLLVTDVRDEFVFSSCVQYENKPFIRIDSEEADISDAKKETGTASDASLNDAESQEIVTWLKTTLKGSVGDVKISKRLVSHPAIVTGHQSATDTAFSKYDPQISELYKSMRSQLHKLEINTAHPIIVALYRSSKDNKETAEVAAKQLLSNALIAAGQVDDPRELLDQLNKLLEVALKK